MNPGKSLSPGDMSEEVSALIETLHRTAQRLEELTAGELDAVADPDGRSFLLRPAQEELRRSEAARQAAIQEALAQSEAGLHRAQLMAKLAHVITGADGSFETWSETLPQLIGVEPDQLPRSTRAWLDILHPDDRARFRDKAIEAGVGKLRLELEYRLRRADGQWIHVRQTMETLKSAGEETGDSRWFNTLQDVTERKEAEDEIRRLNETLEQRVAERTAQLESVNEELKSFSYSVSHDLRAPLRHVLGFVELLREDAGPSLSEESLRHLTTIATAATRMADLIDDLLAFSSVGSAELRRTVVNLDELVRDTLADFQAETEARDIVWKIHPLPPVRADRALLRMVLVNLISNAVKFTGARAEPRIEIGCAPLEDGETAIFVRDNGAGFDPKYAAKLFGVFQRLHSQTEFEGTGI